jgi:hypothetical protein
VFVVFDGDGDGDAEANGDVDDLVACNPSYVSVQAGTSVAAYFG